MLKIKKHFEYYLMLIVGLMIISLCFNQSLWADEAWTTLLMQDDFKTMMHVIGSDVHPPLYFVILKIIVSLFGHNIVIMKMVSVVPVIILMLLGNYYIKKLFDNRLIAIIFIILVGLSPSCLHMAVEVRMYSWSILFVTWTGFLGYDIYLNNKFRDKILFAISGILAAYTHNFNIIAEIFVYGIFFLVMFIKNKKTIKDSLMISIITIAGYLPWLLISFSQLSKVNENFWLWPINFTDIAQMIIYPFNSLCHNEIPSIWILLFIGLPLAVSIILLFTLIYKVLVLKQLNNEIIFALLCYLPMYGLIVFGITYGLLIRPIFVARYMHCTLGLFYLSIAIAIASIDRKEVKVMAQIILMLNIIYGYIFNFDREYLNGTNDTLEFLEEAKNDYNTRLIVTDIFLLSTTTLHYYEPEYSVFSSDNYDVYTTNEQLLFFADNETNQLNLGLLESNNISYSKIYSGDIDDEYFFDVYLIN